MKLSQFRKGFTLVEIMIVVVIIGILATLAVPALKSARNSAVEKTLFNDARQLSSAANQYFADTGGSSVTVARLVGPNNYISSLSAGTLIAEGKGSGVDSTMLTTAANLWTSTGGQAVTLTTSSDAAGATKSMFRLGNVGYDTSLSSNPQIVTSTQGGYNANKTAAIKDIGLVFAVETGALLKKTATSADQTAAYGT